MTNNTKKKTPQTDALQQASAEIGNLPPQAPEVEEAVIGSMLLDSECVYQAMEALKEASETLETVTENMAPLLNFFR